MLGWSVRGASALLVATLGLSILAGPLLGATVGCGRASRDPRLSDSGLLVFAVAGLKLPLERIASRFHAETGVPVTFTLSRSDTLAAEILSGEAADLFMSGDEAQMDRLAAAGLIDTSSRVRLLSDRLVVVVPAASTLAFQVPGDLTAPAVRRFALSDPAAEAAGRHGQAYLQTRGVWPPLEPRVVYFAHVRAALTAVELGTAQAGIVYRSDAGAAPGVRVLLEIDEDPRWTVGYSAAVLRRAPHAKTARRFLDWLKRDDSRTLFEEAGFLAASGSS